MTTTLPCPVCGKPLFAERLGENQLIFCAYGPCPSHAANEGAEGATPQEACEKLRRMVQEELEQNEPDAVCHDGNPADYGDS